MKRCAFLLLLVTSGISCASGASSGNASASGSPPSSGTGVATASAAVIASAIPSGVASSAPLPSAASARVPAAGAGEVFPLVAGARYSFVGSFHGKTSTTELELRAVDGQGEKVFHFAEIASTTKLVAPTFGLGAFAARADGLYTADALRSDELAALPKGAFHKLLGAPAKVGAVEKVTVPAKGIVPGIAATYRVGAVEPVTVPAGTFEGCVRLDIETVIDGEKDSSSVWLAPGIGPVKLRRATGRVDELTKGPSTPR